MNKRAFLLGLTLAGHDERVVLERNGLDRTAAKECGSTLPHAGVDPVLAVQVQVHAAELGSEDPDQGCAHRDVDASAHPERPSRVGDAQAMVIQTDGTHKMLTRKHDPAEPSERSRIREAGGWVSRNGRLNDLLQVSRAFGYVDLMPAVQAAPYVSNMTLKETDDIILIATRELWEYLSPGLVTDIARAERGDLMRAAQKLAGASTMQT